MPQLSDDLEKLLDRIREMPADAADRVVVQLASEQPMNIPVELRTVLLDCLYPPDVVPDVWPPPWKEGES